MPYTSKIHASVNIYFIRKIGSKAKDDSVLIRATDTPDLVYLRYIDTENNSRHELFLTGDQLRAYFVSLFHVLSYDKEPFESVQVNFPAFPCVLLDVNDLGYESLRLRLQAMIDFTLKTSFAPDENEDEDDDDATPDALYPESHY
jgi:hypothetical protein